MYLQRLITAGPKFLSAAVIIISFLAARSDIVIRCIVVRLRSLVLKVVCERIDSRL